jgi:beta-fructofuranosidase
MSIAPEQIKAARNLRLHLLDDPWRPTFHFVVPEDYAKPADPNGAIWWNGRYHLGYIYQDDGVHYWGHVSSRDLLHWRHHKPWLLPTPDSPEEGIFSGNAMIDKNGEVSIFYHGVKVGNCIATSSEPLLENFRKLPSNPIVPVEAPDKWRESAKLPYASWDPHGWLDGDTYYAIFGGSQPAIFKARELGDWSYVGDLFANTVDGTSLREDVSCPDFFKLGDKWVLMGISHEYGTRYFVGDWKNEQFHPQVHERMSWIDNTYFAPESMEAPDGRRIMWAWIFDQWDEATEKAAGWSGVFAVPRELSLRDDLRLAIRPVEELKQLRYNERTLASIGLAAGTAKALAVEGGNVIDIEAEFDPGSATRVGLQVSCAADGSEATIVGYDAVAGELFVDTTSSSRRDLGLKVREAGPLKLAAGEKLKLRILVDRSVVEVFANDRQAITRRIYPDPASTQLGVFAEGGTSQLTRLAVWDMMPSNPY